MAHVDRSSVEEALRVGIAFHGSGDLDMALAIYRDILDVAPDQPDALHFSGLLSFQRGDRTEGIDRVRRALEVTPGNAAMWSNLGNMLKLQGETGEAEQAYRQAIELAPELADGHCNLGVVLRSLGHKQAALESFRRALECDAEHAETLHNLGNLFTSTRQWPEAIDCYRRVVDQDTDLSNRNLAAESLIRALACVGEHDEIRNVLERWRQWDPDNPIASHLFAAYIAENVPARASDAYVTRLFDVFADTFDEVLGGLDYRAPQLVADRIEGWLGSGGAALDVMDAGCGTGLAGPLLRPHAGRLVGLDISAGMLDKAAARGVYDELVAAEMTAHLAQERSRYDLIACIDSLVYFGELEAVLAAFHGALAASGRIVFTVERCAAEPFRLDISGRYQHEPAYVREAVLDAGFRDVELDEVDLRLENGQPVRGLLVSARRAAAGTET